MKTKLTIILAALLLSLFTLTTQASVSKKSASAALVEVIDEEKSVAIEDWMVNDSIWAPSKKDTRKLYSHYRHFDPKGRHLDKRDFKNFRRVIIKAQRNRGVMIRHRGPFRTRFNK